MDDNIFNVIAIQTILEGNYGLKSDMAMNGEDAVRKVEERERDRRKEPCTCGREAGNYALVFMDCNMPVMDGFEATRLIKNKLGERQAPMVVALTAYNTEGFKEKSEEYGMDRFLTKPLH